MPSHLTAGRKCVLYRVSLLGQFPASSCLDRSKIFIKPPINTEPESIAILMCLLSAYSGRYYGFIHGLYCGHIRGFITFNFRIFDFRDSPIRFMSDEEFYHGETIAVCWAQWVLYATQFSLTPQRTPMCTINKETNLLIKKRSYRRTDT